MTQRHDTLRQVRTLLDAELAMIVDGLEVRPVGEVGK